MRPLALVAFVALVCATLLPAVLTPSFAQIAPAITTTASRPPLYLPFVIQPGSASSPTITTTAPPAQPATATPTTTDIAQPATATPTRTAPPAQPSSTPSLPPPSFKNCQADPNPSAAPNYPIGIVAIDKDAETVTLRNVTSNDTIDLTGWTMCSITGNQQHPISGTLSPGQERTFPGPAANIWNNSLRDDGALYTPTGQLVSYYQDT